MSVYPNLPLGVTEPEEYEMLRQHVPWLWTRPGDMLFVGANQLRPPFHAQRLKQHGWRLHLVEIFPGNVEHHRHTRLFETVTLGDVRNVEFPDIEFVCAFWWHGIEHIPQGDVTAAVQRLESIAPRVVLGCPNGHSPQGTVYGNEAENHQWDVLPSDLQVLGYETVTYEAKNRRHILAWKERK